MSQDEELFRHKVTPWTVGQLRQALDGLPEDLPLRVWVAEEPGGDGVDTQVVVGASFARVIEGDGQERIDRTFGIECEFPSGSYYRRAR